MQCYLFVLLPRFSLVSLACAVDALRGANQVLKEPGYNWHCVSAEGGFVSSSSGLALETGKINRGNSQGETIVLCGGNSSHNYKSTRLEGWLHDRAKAGHRIGSVSDGSFVLAEAGLFDQVASTIHWKCFDAYRERFPYLEIKPSIMEISRNRFSCAGGTASLDLMLHFIREDYGPDITSQVAENYFHDTIRDGSREQHLTNAFRMGSRNPVLAQALLLMENHLEARIAISDIAEIIGISRRQLDRIFKRELKRSPLSFYRDLRLTRASGLLLQTGMSVTEIAVACGFQSASHLGRYFQEQFSLTPGAYRRQNAIR